MKIIESKDNLLNGDKEEAFIANGFKQYSDGGNIFDNYYTEMYTKKLLKQGYAIALQEYNYNLGNPEAGSIYNIIWYKKI